MRDRFKKLVWWLFLGLCTMFLFGVGGEFFIHVAEDKGWYANAGRNWDTFVQSVTSFLSSNYVVYPLLLSAGTLIGQRLDTWLAKRERTDPDEQRIKMDALNEHLGQTMNIIGQALGSEDGIAYELAVSQSETLLMGLAKWNDFEIPDLRDGGVEAGTLRAFIYLSAVMAPLRLNDEAEVRSRAAKIVPQLNAKNADQLRADIQTERLVSSPEIEWWQGLESFTIRRAGCLVAGCSETGFIMSTRANAVADEITGLVNEGWIPLAREQAPLGDLRIALHGRDLPPYPSKNVALNAVISRESLEEIASGRGWTLPWPIPPKEPETEPQSPQDTGPETQP